MLRIEYTGSNKVIKALCKAVNHIIDKDYKIDGAYNHAQITSGNPHRVSLEDLGIARLPSQVDSLMKAFGTLTPWTEHSVGAELTTHTGETIYFQTTSRVLEYH